MGRTPEPTHDTAQPPDDWREARTAFSVAEEDAEAKKPTEAPEYPPQRPEEIVRACETLINHKSVAPR